MEGRLTIEYVPLAEIVPYQFNPRKNEEAVDIVAKSIQQYGFLVPIILDKDNVIVAGHTRYKASQKLGLTEVPVLWADHLNEAQVRAFRLMDNRSNEYAKWDEKLLKVELEALRIAVPDIQALLPNLDIDLSVITGFSDAELLNLAPTPESEEVLPDETTPKYDVKIGDIYQCGNHRVMCGDATNTEHVTKLMNGKTVDCLLTDPPYGVDYGEKNKFLNSIGKGNRIETPIRNDNQELDVGSLLKTVLGTIPFSDKNTIYVFTSGKHISNFIQAFEQANCYYSQDLKWVKNNHVLGRMDYMPKSENILYGWKGTHEFYGGFQTDVLLFDKPQRSDLHPTMKPVDLLETLLSHGSKKGDSIYDPFGGSGSTLIASEKMSRICYTMELDPIYTSIIIERWENLTKQQAVKV